MLFCSVEYNINKNKQIMSMKKLLFLLAMTLTTVGMWAQSWKPTDPQDEKEFSSTWIIAQLKTNLTNTKIVIGAFVDGQWRVDVQPEATASEVGGNTIYSIRVPSYVREADDKKPISFKAYDPQTGLEYELKETLEFQYDGTYGSPTQPVMLNLNAPTSYAITLAEIQVGQAYKLADYLTTTPQTDDIIIPYNLVWTAVAPNQGQGITVDKGVLKATTPMEGVTVAVSAPGANNPLASVTVDVVSHATGIEIVKQKVEVEKSAYGTQQLNLFVSAADDLPYKILPVGTTDKSVKWEIEKPANGEPVLQYDGNSFTILRGGEARIRPFVEYIDKNKKDNNGKPLTVTVYPKDGSWITVAVSVPIEEIKVDEQMFGTPVKVNMTDKNIYQRLKSIVSILPTDASNRNFRFQCFDQSVEIVDAEDGTQIITPKKVGAGIITVISEGKTAQSVAASAPAVEGNDAAAGAQQLTKEIDILIENPAIDVTLDQPAMRVYADNGEEVNLESRLKEFITYIGNTKQNTSITITPVEGTSVTGSAQIGGANGDVYNLVAKGDGSTKVTTLRIALKWHDYDNWKGTPTEAEVPEAVKNIDFDVIVMKENKVDRFYVTSTQAVTNKDITLTLTPFPEDATYDPADVNLTFALNGQYAGWSKKVLQAEKSTKDNKVVWTFSTSIPGEVSITSDQNLYEGQNKFTGINVGYGLSLNKDWQWRSNPWGGVKSADIATVFGGEKVDGQLIEIRTQTDLLYNDDTFGYFGTLMDEKTINMFECYKVRMKKTYTGAIYSTPADNAKALPSNVKVSNTGVTTITLAPGWNWMGNPYFFNRSIAKVMSQASAELPDGLVIVGKEGSVEYETYADQELEDDEELDPTWTNGTLDYLQAGQGYLVYNPSKKDLVLNFPTETAWEPENEDADAGVKAYSLEYSGIWTYNHSRFMNNMTVVAELCGIAHPENYSLGAFVGNECRGEGVVRNGKVFITVHSDGGEYVKFRLYNRLTGELEDIREGLRVQTRVGSLKYPLQLHGTATGIQGIDDENTNESASFDLTGRRVSGQQRGINIQRLSNGTYRKVVVK